MRYRIEKSSEKPVYIQIYEQLRSDIVRGAYPYNGRLPSKRLLSEELGVSVVTVEHTYSLLCDEGYAEARERSGYFVSYRESDNFNVIDFQPAHRLVEENSAELANDFPFSVFAKTMRRVLSEYREAILVKSPNSGCPELKEALVHYLARSRGINVSPEQIVIGSRTEYLYGLIVQLLGRERKYAIENPSYEKIGMVYRANGIDCDPLMLGHDGIRSEELARTDASVLHISPYRSFPSGVTASASKRREYINWASADGRFIIEDDFESEFALSSKPEETVFSLSENDNIIYLNTFSKTIAPSIRIGYMVLPHGMTELFAEKIGFYSCTVPTFEQYVLAEFIQSGDFERHINRVRRRKRKLLTQP